ncbi:MAG: NTP transferase domain-containing protein [Synergistaceae bacterium]|jgi:CTP:molybdopterin cytidylyltransferase MocA|nr:NTP transferase domain-containing protein [Synergistaceae bacterium]
MKKNKGRRVAGLVLAERFSGRREECAALLPIRRVSALEQIVTRMRGAGVRDILVVTGDHEGMIRKEAVRLGCSAIFNPAYESGMYSGILAGVREIQGYAESFFLMYSGAPLVKTATYKSLINAFYECSGNPDIVYPSFGGLRGNPPLIGRAMIDPILAWKGESGLRGLLAEYSHSSMEAPTGDRAIMLRIDTTEGYADLRRYAKYEAFPDEEECGELVMMAGTPARAVRHMRVVARCGMLISDALEKSGVKLNRDLLLSACLLHDLAKGEKFHEAKGARWLRKMGYKEVAELVASHKDLPRGSVGGEAEILYLSDKITDGETVSTLSERLKEMEERFNPNGGALSAARRRIKRASGIQRRIEKITGISLGEMLSCKGATTDARAVFQVLSE